MTEVPHTTTRLLSFVNLPNGVLQTKRDIEHGNQTPSADSDDFFFKLGGKVGGPAQAHPSPPGPHASLETIGGSNFFLDPEDHRREIDAVFHGIEHDDGSLDHLFPKFSLGDLESQLEFLLTSKGGDALEDLVPSALVDPQGGFAATMPLPQAHAHAFQQPFASHGAAHGHGGMGLALSATHPGHVGGFTFNYNPGAFTPSGPRKYRRSAPTGDVLRTHVDSENGVEQRRTLRANRRTSYRDLNEGSLGMFGSQSARFYSDHSGRVSNDGSYLDDGSYLAEFDALEDDDEFGKKRKNRRRTSPTPKRRWSPMPIKNRSPAPEPEGLELIPVHPDKAAGATSRFKGVSRHRLTGKWEACLWAQRRQLYLGGFEGEVVAARAYDLAAIIFKGPGAKLNFALEQYTEEELGPLRGLTEEQVIAHLRAHPPAARLH